MALNIEKSEYRVLPGESKIIPVCRFDTNNVKCHKLFGQTISEEDREKIHRYFQSFKFYLECSYNGVKSPFKHTFTSEENGFVRDTVSSSLSEIAGELEDVKRCLDTLASNVDDVRYAIESKYK